MKRRFVAMLLVILQLMSFTSFAADSGEPLATAEEAYLGFRNMAWDDEKKEHYEDPFWTLQKEWITAINSGNPVKFYYFDGSVETAVSLEELSFSGVVTATQRDGNEYINLHADGFGNGVISYTNTNGKTFSIPVESGLPEFGFYSSESASEETYISSFKVTDLANTFYFVAYGGGTITDIELIDDFAEIATAKEISNTCWEITINGSPCDRWYNIQCSGVNPWKAPFSGRYYGIDISNGMPGLKFRGMSWDKKNERYYEDKSQPLENEWNTPVDSGNPVKFYFFDGSNEIPISLSELAFSDVVSGTQENDNEYIDLHAEDFGAGSISYTHKGTTFSLPVTVGLPEFGFYSSETASEETYLSSFKVTDTANTFYFVAYNGGTITSVEPSDGFEDIATVEKISDTCWEIVVTGTPTDRWCNIRYSGVKPWGNPFSDRYYGLEISNGMPGLKFRQMSWDKKKERFYEDKSQPLESEWITSLDSSCPVKFYFFDGDNEIPVSLEDISFSGAVSGTQEDGNEYIDIFAKEFGSGTISYDYKEKIHSLAVTVGLPEFGFYSSESASEETYISSFKVTDTTKTFYFVAYGGGTITDITLRNGFDQVASAEKVSDSCWKITVTGTPDGRWYNMQYSGRDQWNNKFHNRNYAIQISDGTTGLKYRYMQQSNGQWIENQDMVSWKSLDILCDSNSFIRIYYGTDTDYVEVTEIEVTSGDSVVLGEMPDSNGKPFWNIRYVKFGNSVLTYKVGDKTYTQEVTVSLPEEWFFSDRIRDEEHYLPSINYGALPGGSLWLMNDEGFSDKDVDAMVISVDDVPINTWEPVARESNEDRFDIKITLPALDMGDWYHLHVRFTDHGIGTGVNNQVEGNACYVGDYAIGFAWEDDNTGIIRINEGGWRHGNSSQEVNDNYFEFRDLQIAAGIQMTDEQGAIYYLVEENSKKVNLKIIKAWVEELSGDEKVFSLSPDSHLPEKTGYDDTHIKLYSMEGHVSLIRIWAEVEVTIGKETETVKVSMICETGKVTHVVEYRPIDDTVDKLNAYLEELSKNLKLGSIYEVYLAPITYTGTIVIPSNFEAGKDGTDLVLVGTTAEDGASTILKGAVDLNRATTSHLNDIHFKATAECPTAIYGGALLNMVRCSFEGYDIAVDASVGAITVTGGNVFVDNDIAIRVDIAYTVGGMNSAGWDGNTFIGNGTAIQVLSLNEFISSYYFRIVNSNFIGNTLDFDVRCKATLYMYKNYYGNIHNQAKDMEMNAFLAALAGATSGTKINQLVTSNSPNISCNKSITKVITNPRWKYPVLNWWFRDAPLNVVFPVGSPAVARFNLEAPYINILTSDWELETQIVNEEASELIVDPSAFEAEGEKKIDVVDQNENPLGTWTFDEEKEDEDVA